MCDEKQEQRINLKFLVKFKKTPTECYKLLQEAYEEYSLSRARVFDSMKRFSEGRESTEDDQRPGRPVTVSTPETVTKNKQIVRADRRMSIRMIAKAVNADKVTDPSIGCSLEEFSIFFLNFLRSQTDGFLKGNSSSSACNTPRKCPTTISTASTAAGGCQNSGQLEAMPSTTSSTRVLPTASATVPSSATATSSPALSMAMVVGLRTTEEGVTMGAATPCSTRGATSILPATPQNTAVWTTPNLLMSGNGRPRNNEVLNESFSLNDSLQLRSSTPDPFNRRRSLNKVFESAHGNDSPNHISFVEGSPTRSMDSRFSRNDTSTPIRKRNSRNSIDETNTTGNSSFGSITKNKSNDKSNSKKSPGTPLCLGDFIVAPARQKRRTIKDHQTVERSSSEPGGKGLHVQKPKRRVVPTLVSCTTSSFTSPAFRSENNILEIAKEEVPLDNREGVLDERQVLKSQLNDIAKEFTKEPQPFPQALHSLIKNLPVRRNTLDLKINLAEVTNKPLVDRFVLIHSVLIDMNLTSNILTELSFLINLLNTETVCIPENAPTVAQGYLEQEGVIDPSLINHSSSTVNTDIYSILRNTNNCIYYAIGVLRLQKPNLMLLDVTTLKVILENERLELFGKELREQLVDVCADKVRVESMKSNHEVSFHIRQDFNNVFYQQENDTKNNFLSGMDFTAFKQQRDMFYVILKTWESRHLNPAWNFSASLGSQVCSLLLLQENPVNMAHLAKLFISQLIISSNFPHSPTELEMSLPDVDLNKLTKLQQRLVTPSHFSTDYQFPGNQAFFRDFLLACRKSLLFIEQLKIALTAQLIEMNDSSYEILNLSSKDTHGREYNEYVVRPETLATMRILSKFLGLVETLPYSYDGPRNSLVDDRQIELRNMIQPSFDIMGILRKSITERKLIITIPWIVQYISMLDYVTLRLTYYRRVIQLLYELYMNLTTNVQQSIEILHMRPTSTFIVRTSLGWLFDNPNLPEDYYKYRQNRRFLFDFASCNVKEMTNNAVERMSELKEYLNREVVDIVTGTSSQVAHEQQWNALRPLKLSNEISACETLYDPLLENILNVACPFLADFRVSIMPTKFSKSLSRTGRYRHITTKISEVSSMSHEQRRADDTQTKLCEAFLHSQSLSVRKIVEFVIERTTSAVIKDFQIEILIPSKANAMVEVEKIESGELKQISDDMLKIFRKTHHNAMQSWDERIPKMIEERVKKALDALLPRETLEAIRRTCTALVVQKCKIKTNDWRQSNLHNLDFYSKDIMGDAEKILKTSVSSKKSISTALVINMQGPLPSKMFERLQFILCFSTQPSFVLTDTEIIEFCENSRKCLMEQKLPSSMIRLAGVMSVNLIENLIQYRCDIVSDKLINSFIDFWKCDALRDFVDFSLLDSSEGDDSKMHDYIFTGLLTKFYIQLLANNVKAFDSLTRLMIALVNANLLTIDYLNQQFLSILQIEWQNGLNQTISTMLDNIARSCKSAIVDTDDKSQLFMEMLADLTRDLDDF